MADHRPELPQPLQALPSVGAIAIWMSGKPIEWWAGMLGVLFLLLQIGYLTWKWRRDIRRERQREQAGVLTDEVNEDE